MTYAHSGLHRHGVFSTLLSVLIIAISAHGYAEPPRLLKTFQPPRVNVILKFELRNMAFGQRGLTFDEAARLDEFLVDLRVMVMDTVIIAGHADKLEVATTQDLAERRSVAVKNYIVEKGIDLRRIFWEGKTLNETAVDRRCNDKLGRRQLIDCLAPNRGVTIEVVGSVSEGPSEQRLRRYTRT